MLAWIIPAVPVAISALALSGVLPLSNASLYLIGGLAAGLGLAAVRLRHAIVLILASIFASLFASEALVLGIEYATIRPREFTVTQTAPYFVADDRLRTRILPDAVTQESMRFTTGEFTYEKVTYTSDPSGRRTTPNRKTIAPQAHALFLGCSFTFGQGVADDATLPAQFARYSNGYFQAYNDGVPGAGPSQAYLRLLQPETFDEVRPREGIAIFSFIPDHLNRVAAYKLSRLLYIAGSPLFRLDEAGNLDGPFYVADDPDLKVRLDRYTTAWDASPTIRRLLRKTQPPYRSEREAIDVAVRVLAEARAAYDAQFEGTFYVLIWPRNRNHYADYGYLLKAFENVGIPLLLPEPLPAGDGARIHPWDQHPSAAEYAWVAQEILRLVPEFSINEEGLSSQETGGNPRGTVD